MQWPDQLPWPQRPVWGLNWFEARAYARWLNLQMQARLSQIGLGSQGYTVQLPTELQWERAARASSKTAVDARTWPWGDDQTVADQQSNVNSSVGRATTVGLYPASPLGLLDMAGNVWDWMDNAYETGPTAARLAKDAKVIETADRLPPALRGGSWADHPVNARCSYRGMFFPGGCDYFVGVRVVLSLAK